MSVTSQYHCCSAGWSEPFRQVWLLLPPTWPKVQGFNVLYRANLVSWMQNMHFGKGTDLTWDLGDTLGLHVFLLEDLTKAQYLIPSSILMNLALLQAHRFDRLQRRRWQNYVVRASLVKPSLRSSCELGGRRRPQNQRLHLDAFLQWWTSKVTSIYGYISCTYALIPWVGHQSSWLISLNVLIDAPKKWFALSFLDYIIAMDRSILLYAANLKNFREESETKDMVQHGQRSNAVRVQTLGACCQARIQTVSWQL